MSWSRQVWSNAHSTRPTVAGDLLAGREVAPPFPAMPPKSIPQPNGGGDRNAIPLYVLPNSRVISHFLPDMPIRVSALRGLGVHLNIFALESFMDELAAAAGHLPLAHLEDARAAAVIRRAATRFGWQRYEASPNRGRGFAFARYKNHGAYLAIALDVERVQPAGRAATMMEPSDAADRPVAHPAGSGVAAAVAGPRVDAPRPALRPGRCVRRLRRGRTHPVGSDAMERILTA